MSLTGKIINTICKIASCPERKRSKYRLFFIPFFPLAYIFFITGLIFFSCCIDYFFYFPQIVSYPLNFILGFPLIATGLMLSLACVFYFLKEKGTPVPLCPPYVLITKGPYKYVRNPMLVGLFIQLFGYGLFFNSLSLFFIVAPVIILFCYFELKLIEEPELEKRFGKEYSDYKKNVPMFIPKLLVRK